MSWVIFDLVDRLTKYSRDRELRLAEAIAVNDLATVRQLLNQGVDPNVKIVGERCEPLVFLIFEKNYFTLPSGSIGDRPTNLYHITAKIECLRLLIQHGVDLNVRDSLGRTVLEIAILWCLSDLVKLLLINGADPNAKDAQGITPLMKTAILGIKDARPLKDKLQIALHLIDSGAELNAQSPEGKTALMYATGNSRLEFVELLVSSGASILVCDRQGHRACDIIDRSVTPQQRDYLQRILTQPQLNLVKYKYQQLIPEGDRLLNSIL